MNRGVIVGTLVLALATGLGACRRGGGDDGPRCDQVGARFLLLARAQIAGAAEASQLDATSRQMVEGTLPAIRDALVRACTEQRWSPATRTCFVEAADGPAVQACHAAMPADQRAALDLARLGQPPR